MSNERERRAIIRLGGVEHSLNEHEIARLINAAQRALMQVRHSAALCAICNCPASAHENPEKFIPDEGDHLR